MLPKHIFKYEDRSVKTYFDHWLWLVMDASVSKLAVILIKNS